MICMATYLLVFNLSVVRGSSMAPGIHDGDRILVGQWSYLLSDVARGDVVVMRYPVDPRLDYIKRVIGLPGDEIRMSNGGVWVNGEQLEEPYVDELDDDVVLSVDIDGAIATTSATNATAATTTTAALLELRRWMLPLQSASQLCRR